LNLSNLPKSMVHDTKIYHPTDPTKATNMMAQPPPKLNH